MAWLVLIAILAVPVAEITLFVKVAQTIGVVATIAAAVLAGVAGTMLVRAQGLATALSARSQLERGEMPVTQVFDALCLVAAGVLLVLPGFLSDLAALPLLVPPVRRRLARWLAARMVVVAPRPGPPIIDGDYREVPPDRLEH